MSQKTTEPNVEIVGSNPAESTAIRTLVDRIAIAVDDTKAAKAKETALKQQLVAISKEAWFNFNSSLGKKEEQRHIFDAVGRTAVAQINLVNRYNATEEIITKLKALLGKHCVEQHIVKKEVQITIDVTDFSARTRGALLDEIIASEFISKETVVEMTAKSVVRDTFHGTRHIVFIPAVNKAVDKILPAHVQITV